MPEFTVVLVEPKVEGNVGAIARSMANFGLRDLVLVNPCPLGDDAYKRAKHGHQVLEGAQVVARLEDAVLREDLVVGTTGIPTRTEKAFHRQALTPWELASKLFQVEGRIAILLGREDYGLYNEELDKVDILVSVPCSPEYPVMNISHAITVILYELYKARVSDEIPRPRVASGFEKERLFEAFGELLTAIKYPGYKRRRTQVMFRRLMGRATPSKWEFYALMGVLRGASKTIRRLSESPGRGPSS
ncbi:MAG: RNA methyltransferase [Candidatus Geothermarchaeales archaeon]